MNEQVAARPLVRLVGDPDAAYCDPKSGVCELRGASHAKDSDERPETAGAR